MVTPGIRPSGAELNDQQRVATPGRAIADGADYLVIGRPIRDAADPDACIIRHPAGHCGGTDSNLILCKL
jgi:orotidine-5'-phosphate decarboxylase